MKLVINLATRGRPEHLAWTLEKTLPNIKSPHTMLMVSMDEDDEATVRMVRLRFSDRVWMEVGPREDSVGAKYNRALKIEGDVYLPMVDYVAHLTPGFDEKILAAAASLGDGIGVVYGHMANFSFPYAQAMTKKFVKKMGYIYPEFFPYWFIDHWVDDVVRMIGRIAYVDVGCEAMHQGRQTHEFREPAFWAAFYDAMLLERRRQADSIVTDEGFDAPAWQKTVLQRNYYLHEHRSNWINNQVRTMPFPSDYLRSSGGERYERLRKQAEQKMRAAIPEIEDAAGVLRVAA